MAAGTDITHPVSALEGVHKRLPLESHPGCTVKENGTGLDNREFTALEQNMNDREAVSRPPRPIPVVERSLSSVRRSVSTVQLTSVSCSSDLVLRRRPCSPGRTPEADGIYNVIFQEGCRRGKEPNRNYRDSCAIKVENKTIDPPATESGSVSVEYMPVIRSGGWMDMGSRKSMEDTHLIVDDLIGKAGSLLISERPGSFYGVFDGHGGSDAAIFVKDNLLTKILEDVAFPTSMCEALRNAFLQTDHALVDLDTLSGTTALTAMVFGRALIVANAGDCRAVLSKRGKAVNMSRDHKAGCSLEKSRIEAAGGFVYDGYLNGQLAVARALGDWQLQGLKVEPGIEGPLTAEPEVKQATLTEEDEFLIIGCDGLWDVFTSQNAVDFARKRLQEHNDPERCSKELITEALIRQTADNLTVVTVCFSPNPPPKWQCKPQSTYVPRFRRSVSAEGLKSLQGFIDTALKAGASEVGDPFPFAT